MTMELSGNVYRRNSKDLWVTLGIRNFSCVWCIYIICICIYIDVLYSSKVSGNHYATTSVSFSRFTVNTVLQVPKVFIVLICSPYFGQGACRVDNAVLRESDNNTRDMGYIRTNYELSHAPTGKVPWRCTEGNMLPEK